MDNKTEESPKNGWGSRVSETIDRMFVPFTYGTLSVLILVQIVTAIPSVRRNVDNMEGRFVTVSATQVPDSVKAESATISLYLSPDREGQGIQVLVNGCQVARFSTPQVQIVVHEGDKITVIAPNLVGEVFVRVDHDVPNLLFPAPGQTVRLGPEQREVDIGTARFTS